MEQLRNWLALLESKWWGTLLVYGSVLASTYSALWLIFDSQNIPSRLEVLSSNIDRGVALLVISIVTASHFSLVLELVYKHRVSLRTRSLKDTPSSRSNSLHPKRKDLIVERVAMRDGRLSKEIFASRILLAVNCKAIDERSAREFLRGSTYGLRLLHEGIFTLDTDIESIR